MSALHQHTAERSCQDLGDSSYTYTQTDISCHSNRYRWMIMSNITEETAQRQQNKSDITINLPITHLLYYSRQRLFLHKDTAKKHAVRCINANMFTHHKKHTPAACMWVTTTALSRLYYQSIFSVRELNTCFSNNMLLWDHSTTAILAGCKPCLLRGGNPRAPQHFLNNIALSGQILLK